MSLVLKEINFFIDKFLGVYIFTSDTLILNNISFDCVMFHRNNRIQISLI